MLTISTFTALQKKIAVITLVYVTCFLIILAWPHGAQLIYFWDASQPIDVGSAIKTISSIIRYDFWPGRVDPSAVAMLPYFGLLWLASLGGHALPLGQKIVFTGLLATPAVGMYFLTGFLFEQLGIKGRARTTAQVIAAFGYAFNPFVLTNLWRIFSTNTFGYALHPFLAYFALRFIINPKAKYLLAAGILFIIATPGYSNLAAYAASSLGIVIPWVLLSLSLSSIKLTKIVVGRAACYASLLAIFSLWFVLPQLFLLDSVSSNGSFGGTYTALEQNTLNANIYNSMRLVGGSATYETINNDPDYPWVNHYNTPPFVEWFSTNFYVFLTIFGFIFVTRRKPLRYITVGFLSSLFLSTGTKNIFTGWLFDLAFHKIGFFQAFRNPFDKFGIALSFWEFIIIAFGTYYILKTCAERWHDRWNTTVFEPIPIEYAFGIIISFFFAIAAWPLLTGAVQRQKSIRPESVLTFPPYFANLCQEVTKHWPTLILPLSPGPLVAEKWNRGYVGFDPLRFATYLPILSTDTSDLSLNKLLHTVQADMSTGQNIPEAKTVLQSLGFHSIIVREDTDTFFTPESHSAPAIISFLRKNQTPESSLLSHSPAKFFQLDPNTPQVGLGASILNDIASTDTPIDWMYRFSAHGLLDQAQSGFPQTSSWYLSQVHLMHNGTGAIESQTRVDGSEHSMTTFTMDGKPITVEAQRMHNASAFRHLIHPIQVPTLTVSSFKNIGEIPNNDFTGPSVLKHTAKSIRLQAGKMRPYIAYNFPAAPWLRFIALEINVDRPKLDENRASIVVSSAQGSHELEECILPPKPSSIKGYIQLFCNIPAKTDFITIFLSTKGGSESSSITYSNPKLFFYETDPHFMVFQKIRSPKNQPSLTVIRQNQTSADISLSPGDDSLIALKNTCYLCGWRLQSDAKFIEPGARLNFFAPVWHVPKHDSRITLHFKNVIEGQFFSIKKWCGTLMTLLLIVFAFYAWNEQHLKHRLRRILGHFSS